MKKLLLATAATLALSGAAWAESITATATVDSVVVDISSTTGTGTLNLANQAFGAFNLNTLSVNDEALLAAPNIVNSNTLNLITNPNVLATETHNLVLDIMVSGLVGPGAIEGILNEFSVTGLTAGWNAREQTYINGVLQADTGVFTANSASADFTSIANLTNPFTAEVRYTVNSLGTGGFNGGIDMTAAPVPGPIVGAGIPGLMAAFSFFGLNRFRRRKLAA